jgi:hypothetical protein
MNKVVILGENIVRSGNSQDQRVLAVGGIGQKLWKSLKTLRISALHRATKRQNRPRIEKKSF